jgi:hypothetical protein
MLPKSGHPLAICGLLLLAGCGGSGGSSSSDSTTSTEPYTGTCGIGTAVYALAAGSKALASPSFNIVAENDRSAFCAQNSSTSITLVTPTINSSATTSSTSDSSLYGLSAAVLAYGSSATSTSGGSVTVSGGTITTTSDDANAAFASGKGASITLSNVDAYTTGAGARAVVATKAGTATVTGGTTLTATAAEVAMLEGASTMTISNSTLLATNANSNRGIYLYGSTAASSGASTLTMTGGSYLWSSASASASAFYVYNQITTINLNGVAITNATSRLLTAAAGSIGSAVTLNAVGQALAGSIVADADSTVALSHATASTLSGAINSANTGAAITVTLDATSTWTVTANSYVTVLADTAGIAGTAVTNIVGNGFNVYYKSSSNPALVGATYTLVGGGWLIPY